jgi:hypothetical protein
VIAGAFWFYRTSTLNSIADARAAVVKEREDFRDKVLKVDLTNEAALVAIREEIKDKIKIWKGKDVENDISTHLAKINSAYALIQKTRTLVDQLKGIETQLAANPPAEQLAKLFAQVRDSELAAQAAEAGGNYKTQYDTDVKTVTSKYVEALRARASPSGTTGEALAPYGPLEDTLRIVVDAAQMANDIDTVNQYKNSYTQCVAEINGIAEKLFDDAYIEKQAWKDLLADPGSWLVAESGSFTRKFGSGTLLLDNAEGGQSGGVLYTPGGQWRDYVLEMEVKLDMGTLSVFTRVGDENKLDTNAVPGFTFGTKNTKLNADYGRTQTLQVRVIGKKITVYVDNSPLYDDSLGLNKSRRGKPCLAVSGGTTANISKLRVKLLR